MKILLTSLGHVGGAVAASLSGEYEIRALLRRDSDEQVEVRIGDVRSYESVRDAARGVDAIVHTAGLWGRHKNTHSYREFYETNMTGTFNVLEAAAEQDVEKVVFASTAAVYEGLLGLLGRDFVEPKAIRMDEETQVKEYDIYTATKIMGEELCEHYSRKKGLTTICLRLANVPVGEGEPQHAAQFHRGWKVDVRDCVEAIRCALQSEKIRYGVYHVAAPLPYTEEDDSDLVQNPEAVLRKYFNLEFEYLKAQGVEVDMSPIPVYFKSDLAQKELGLRYKYDFKKLVEDLK